MTAITGTAQPGLVERTLNDMKLGVLCIALVLVGQFAGSGAGVVEALPGAIMMLAIIVTSLRIKELLPSLPLPAFAWATLIGLILSLPGSPASEVFMTYTDKIGFLATTTPLLAFAGLSVGNQLDKLKALSWRIVLVAFVVFTSAFFGASAVAHVVLKFTGVI